MLSVVVLSVFFTSNANARIMNTQPEFIILKIAEYPPYITAENNTEQEGGVWDKTKEISSDVWDGTKEVSSDVWDGAKTVTGDVWNGAKEVGSDVKKGLSGDNNTTTQSNDKKNKQ